MKRNYMKPAIEAQQMEVAEPMLTISGVEGTYDMDTDVSSESTDDYLSRELYDED